jgi:hypothetical protein
MKRGARVFPGSLTVIGPEVERTGFRPKCRPKLVEKPLDLAPSISDNGFICTSASSGETSSGI